MKITQMQVTKEQMNREINELCYNGGKIRKVHKDGTIMWLGNVISLQYFPVKINLNKVESVIIKPSAHKPADNYEIIMYYN